MAWYDDPSRTRFVGKYSNAKQLEWDLEKAVRRGWTRTATTEQTVSGASEGASVGRREEANSTPQRLTVTFVRSAEWALERERTVAADLLLSATKAADDREAKLLRALDGLKDAESAFVLRCDAAIGSKEPSAREKAERELVAATKHVLAKRREALKCFDDTLEEMASAVSVGASEFTAILSRYQRERAENGARMHCEQLLLQTQTLVAEATKEWRVALDRQEVAQAELLKRTAGFERAESELSERVSSRQAALKQLSPMG